MVIKTKSPKIAKICKNQEKSKLATFGDFVLIAMDKANVLQNVHNYLQKPENFLQMVVDLLLLIWFAQSDQNKIAKNHRFSFS